MADEPDHVAYARFFASLGLQIVPLFGPHHGPAGSFCMCREGSACASPAKHPRARYKGQPSRLPGLLDNYAIVLDRFVVVDVDDMETLERLFDVIGFELPETYTIRTGRGAHLWFEHTEPLATRLGAYPKVDLKSGFTYVVGPGSRSVNGKVYEPVISAPIAKAPSELVAAYGKQRTYDAVTISLPSSTHPVAMPGLIKWCDEIRASQTRNNDLLRFTCRAYRMGIYSQDAIDMLGDAAVEAGLSRAEVERTMNSAYRSVSTGE